MLCSLWIGSCQPNATTQNPTVNRDGKPDVVTTSTIITDWTQQIAGGKVTVVGILKPGDDPHVYEPVPADSRLLEEAKLILYNGYNLEPTIIKLISATGISARRVAVGEVITPLQLSDRRRGVVPDPHVWGSAKNAIVMVKLIRDELIQLSPKDKATFSRNAEAFIRELERLHRWIPQQIQTIPTRQRQLVTTHDAFQYYANAYGLKVVGTLIGISTEEQPSAQTVQQLAESIRQLGVPTIFAETTINPRLITTVAEAAQVKLATPPLYSDSLGAPGSPGDTYITMMVVNTSTIVKNLGGQFTPF